MWISALLPLPVSALRDSLKLIKEEFIMSKPMQRRDFMMRSALTAGGVLLAANQVLAQKGKEFQGYYDVDEELFANINRVAKPEEKTTLEKKHAPVIEAPDKVKSGEPFEVTITVGEIVHPMGATHYIQMVQLYVGNEPAGRVDFSHQFNEPRASFTLKTDKPVTLVVREYCNLHGLWESRKQIALAD